MTSYEQWSLIFTAISIVIGTGVLIVYALQLRAMRKAVTASESATRAAILNYEAFVESQRPQIAATVHGNPARMILDLEIPRMELSLFNRGMTPAYDLTYETWFEMLLPPFSDFTSAADHFKCPDSKVLYPNHDPLIVNIPYRKGLTEQQRIDLKQLRLQACVRLYVEFREGFSSKRKVANFGFVILGTGLGFLPKYNDAGLIHSESKG